MVVVEATKKGHHNIVADESFRVKEWRGVIIVFRFDNQASSSTGVPAGSVEYSSKSKKGKKIGKLENASMILLPLVPSGVWTSPYGYVPSCM